MMRPVTVLERGKRFPRWINSRFVVHVTPGHPMVLDVDDEPVSVPTCVVTMPGETFVVQGAYHAVAERLNGEP